jgi:hypothetical protein
MAPDTDRWRIASARTVVHGSLTGGHITGIGIVFIM